MSDMWEILGNISSICSIVGLPLALWQIAGLKANEKEAEAKLNKLLEMKNNESVEQILITIFNQRKELSQIQASIGREGVKPENLDKRCENIINEINTCIFQMPPQYEEAVKSMEECIDCIQEYLENKNTEKMKDASAYLYSIIRGIKKSKEKYSTKQIKEIAHIISGMGLNSVTLF